jgi:DNA anti-recombination protein RmuC
LKKQRQFLTFNPDGEYIMNNIEMIKEKANEAEEMARKIWLAGLGAYGKGLEEAQGRIETLSSESNKMFGELVSKGEKLETEAKGKFSEAKDKLTTKANVEKRVGALRNKLGLDQSDTEQKIEVLSAKIDKLTAAVAKLAK